MFVNIVHFPAIIAGKDAEFRQWFAWSNEEYAKHERFISRKLLLPREGATTPPSSSTRVMTRSWPCTPAPPRPRQTGG
jgi:hypothetical protein